jgi:ADP-ribosylglycohydrolase
MNVEQRVKNLMLGLAFGDAISWPAAYHRSRLLPPWTRRVRREMDAAAEEHNVLRIPQPFSLNRPSDPFALGPTDDTEWAAFTAEVLVRSNGVITGTVAAEAWTDLAHRQEKICGSIGIVCALENIRRGVPPPSSGRDNPHYFDDSALIRAAVIGAVWPGQPERAAEFARIDASVTNAEDGVWGAQAAASVVSRLCGGGAIDEAVEACCHYLPESSMIHRMLTGALNAGSDNSNTADLVLALQETIVNKVYSYACSAAETLALSLALLRHGRGDLERTVALACAFGKTADGVPALTGALTGACLDAPALSAKWQAQLSHLKGIAIPGYANADYLGLIDRTALLAAQIK